ncbi:MAG: hypothetical protein JW727_01675 [Candidatus Aenigmarchaeota archaeon]|nr:hypothetical protein [Candidatus Aenigmarchaeota archaeon]
MRYLGKFVRLLGLLIMVFPIIFPIMAIFFFSGASVIALFAAFILFLFICSYLGGKVHNLGLEIELHERGIETPTNLRKKLEPLLGDRPPELQGLEVPESLARVNIEPVNAAKKAGRRGK